MIMNIKLIKEKWMKFYKRGFLTGILVLSFFCIIDQTLPSPFYFMKIDSLSILFLNLSVILFGSVFCGLISLFLLLILSFITVPKN